ncbi:MAG: hypothetical protein ABIS68_12440 [Casimicrobiaceae bacterium]
MICANADSATANRDFGYYRCSHPKEQSMPWITVQLLAAGPPSALGSGDPQHPKHPKHT